MAISTRHIRHDWKTFVDWSQVSVRTLCEVTTRRHLAGIPGVTEQPQLVEANGKVKWGWCMRCTREAWREAHDAPRHNMHANMLEMYNNVIRELTQQIEWYNSKKIT